MGRVLITGSEGFTGRYVCDSFKKAGWEVWGAGLKQLNGSKQYVQMDLCEPSSISKGLERVNADIVIHLAAESFVGEVDANIYYRVNLIGTRNLLAALSNTIAKPSLTILASSANVYGNSQALKLNESSSVHPENDYAVSKLSMEYVAELFRDRLNITVVRPFNYTGVGQQKRFLIPKIVDHVRRKQAIIELGNIDIERDFSDVRDIANYYLLLVSARSPIHTINFCSGQAISLRSVLRSISSLSGYEIEVVVNSDLIRENEVFRLVGDRSKLDRLLGARASFDISETIEWMLQG